MKRAPKRSPAFQFYPSNFLGSPKVRAMTAEEIGVYVLCLCLDWEQGGFTIDEARDLAKSAQVDGAHFDAAWVHISRCFETKSERFFNARLQKERAKQRAWRRKSRKGGKIGAAKRWAGHDKGGHKMVTPIDDIPSPSLSPTLTTTAKTKTTTPAAAKTPRVRPPAGWMLPASRIWEARFGAGSFPWGKAGAHLKRLRDQHPPAVIADHLSRYLAKTDAQYVSIPRFVDTFAEYAPIDAKALVDEWGCLTPFGERETRPPGLRIA